MGPARSEQNKTHGSAQLQTLRESLRLELDRIKISFFATRDGLAAVRAISGLMDRIIGDIFDASLARLKPGERAQRLALIALGGYGRRELHPYSDIDLMLLCERRPDKRTEGVIKEVLHALWDLNLRIGHTIRVPWECGRLDRRNVEFSASLIDARFLAGDRALYLKFRHEARTRLFGKNKNRFLRSLIDLIKQRHARYGDTIYQLEPDLKEAPGTLRDVQAALWLAKLIYEIESEQELAAQGAIDCRELEGLNRAREFLLQLRTYLHFLSGRNRDVLYYEMQDEIAPALGYRDEAGGTAVENLMRDYFLNAGHVYRFLKRMIARADSRGRPRETIALLKSAPGNDAGYLLTSETIDFENPNALGEKPQSFLKIFELSQRLQLKVGERSLAAIRERLDLIDERLLVEPENRELFFSMLKGKRGVYDRLSLMHEIGLLGRLFPEFEGIRCHVRRDFYHKYTVDEHSLMAVRNIEELRVSHRPMDERFKELLSELEKPELLLFALLFHDVGKASPSGGHVTHSLELVERILARLQLDPERSEMIRFLVANHLEMSAVMRKRDLSDEEAIERFADLVATPERLKMLCLCTYADIKAVGQETLTAWKADLLWQLYVDTYNELMRGIDDRIDSARDLEALDIDRILRHLPEGHIRAKLERFVDGFPRRYLKGDPARIAEHFLLFEQVEDKNDAAVSISPRGELYQLCVVAGDKPYLFSKITGTLAYFGMNIIRGQGFANKSGLILDVIDFEDPDDTFKLNRSEPERLRAMLREAIRGELDIYKLLESKEKSVLFRKRKMNIPTVIGFDDEHSQKYTVLEIVSQDRLGLLFHISRAISEQGCNIEIALISTEGPKAIDVFYLTKDNKKLAPAVQEQLRSRLLETLA